jgi:DNA mismatch repair protein MutS
MVRQTPAHASSDVESILVQIDDMTQADLGVFGSAGQGGLFELIDRTSTSLGRSALKRRLQQPSSDVNVIQRTQDAVKFLGRHPGIVRLSQASVEAVARYIGSNIAIDDDSFLPARVEYAWMAIRYRDLLNEITAGVRATNGFFTHIARVCEAIEERNPPPALAELAASIEATARAVLRSPARSGSVLGADRAIRSGLRSDIATSLDLIGELDALNSMAAASAALEWVMPELVDSDTFVLDAEGVYHPFVPHAVANPCRLSGGEPMVFLTGPNMAGKTTYLRSVALVVLLAQIGMAVPATRVRVSPVEALFTSLNPADNLRAGLSYFLAEVMRVKEAAAILADGRRALIIFDEVFKGTNVRDALDASAEVILGFANARRSGIIFSSHLVELVDVLEANRAIRFYCFDGDIHDGVPHYSYELQDGVSDKRFGVLLLRQAEVPQLIQRISA